MTEKQWLKSGYPDRLLESLREGATDRKLRLFACACCRCVWDLLTPNGQNAVMSAERFADKQVSKPALSRASAAVGPAKGPLRGYAAAAAQTASRVPKSSDELTTFQIADNASTNVCLAAGHRSSTSSFNALHVRAERHKQCGFIRDIFGNPFRPVALDPAWRTSDVVALARGIYAERAFDRMPILADALQDAGCTNDDVLNHCRDANQVHVRGCWVIDILLGKI